MRRIFGMALGAITFAAVAFSAMSTVPPTARAGEAQAKTSESTPVASTERIGDGTSLVMFYADGCTYCAMWDREVGTGYPNTTEAKEAPLRRVDINGNWPTDLKAVHGVMYTPTFVVMHDGTEVGRITGYPGNEFFWSLLGEILDKAKGPAS